jgi:DNA-binding MarR family transcriptional regulator
MNKQRSERSKCKPPARRTCEIERSEKHDQLDGGGVQVDRGLNSLDAMVVGLLAQERVIRQDRFAPLLGITGAEVAIALNRLRRRKFIERKRFLYDDPAPWVWLTSDGARCAKLSRGMIYIPKVGQLAHADAVVVTRIHYMQKYPKGVWVSERELSKRHSRTHRHLADALVEIPVTGHRTNVIALEIELTRKYRTKLVQIITSLCENGEYRQIHYNCGSSRIKAEVERAKDAAKARRVDVRRLKILDVPDLAGIA